MLVLGQKCSQGQALGIVHYPDVGANSLFLHGRGHFPALGHISGHFLSRELTISSLHQIVQLFSNFKESLMPQHYQPLGIQTHIPHQGDQRPQNFGNAAAVSSRINMYYTQTFEVCGQVPYFIQLLCRGNLTVIVQSKGSV
jgi:hypothetical protein